MKRTKKDLENELADLHLTMNKLSDLLSRTAIALKGPEPPLTKWSFHDLPDLAAAAKRDGRVSDAFLKDIAETAADRFTLLPQAERDVVAERDVAMATWQALRDAFHVEPDHVNLLACITCGATEDGNFEVQDGPGPFCETCWQRLRLHFRESGVAEADVPLEEALGELFKTGGMTDRAFLLGMVRAQREVCEESNAVCICGCPVGDHENYGEDGEGCQNPEHECLRTSKAVYAVIHALREQQKERP